ncbi:hypothetical protein TIFTF001_044135 [Ficus carica]|uniref:Uncharacterized protein n=1 Tax=Ficus carica TaxID=3494 RepID=A0AA88CQW2_FICCA|nr:hypothetical protein TIFTF001_044135 [Ficus carica]
MKKTELRWPGSPSMNSEESATTTGFKNGLDDHHRHAIGGEDTSSTSSSERKTGTTSHQWQIRRRNQLMRVLGEDQNPEMDFGQVWILINILGDFSWALICYYKDYYITNISDRRC